MAAVIVSATVFREQYLKHPMILLAFIWRIHRHTTGMSHKHVEAFQRPGGGGMEGGRWKRRGQQRLVGLHTPHYCHLVFSEQEEKGGCECFFHTLWPSWVVVFTEQLFVDLCTHIRYCSALICLIYCEVCIGKNTHPTNPCKWVFSNRLNWCPSYTKTSIRSWCWPQPT